MSLCKTEHSSHRYFSELWVWPSGKWETGWTEERLQHANIYIVRGGSRVTAESLGCNRRRWCRSKTKSSQVSSGRVSNEGGKRREEGRLLALEKACAAQTGTRDVGDTLVMCTTVRHDQIALVLHFLNTVKLDGSTNVLHTSDTNTRHQDTDSVRKYKTILPCTLRCHWEMCRVIAFVLVIFKNRQNCCEYESACF